MPKKIDWVSIEGEYLAGVEPVTSIASRFGVSEGAIRKKAKQLGWVRDATRSKREKVKAKLANSVSVTKRDESRPLFPPVMDVRDATIDEAVNQDVYDMNLVCSIARTVLGRIKERLDTVPMTATASDDGEEMEGMTVRELKAISETTKLNMEIIRKVRGLDTEEGDYSPEDELDAMDLDDVPTAA